MNSNIEELWIAKDGVCLFHNHWTKKPIDLNIQLFTAFTSAINTFSKTFFPAQPLKSIEFMNTRFLFDYVDKDALIIFKCSTESPTEQQIQFLNKFILDFRYFLQEFNLKKSFTNRGKIKNHKPINEFYYPISSFVKTFIDNYHSEASDVRKYHFLNVIWYIKSLNNIFTSILDDPKFKKREFNNVMLKEYFDPLNYDMNRLTPIIFDMILKMNLNSSFDLKKFRSTFDIEKFPDIPYKDIRHFLKDFIGYFTNLFKSIDDIPTRFRRDIFKSYTENFKVLKIFDLDEAVTTELLPLFY